jgi:hypothetical protein
MYKTLIVCLLLCPMALLAQVPGDWKWEAELETAPRAGFQDIPLGPEVICRLNPESGNLRVMNEAGEEVPWLFFTDRETEQEVSLRWYPRHLDDYRQRWYSRSVFQNPRGNGIDRMVLKIRNAAVRQTFWLSGSDDLNRWYIVKEDFVYDSDYDPASSYNLITIDFPQVDYKYYKVEIRHHWHEPIQIMGAGYYAVSESEGNYQTVPRPAVVQHESGSKSIVDIRFDGRHYLDRVFFEVDGPEMYHRDAVLKRKTAGGGYEQLESFVLDSRSVHLLQFQGIRVEELRLEIENHDDKPLRVAGVQAMQLRRYLTAKLDPAVHYTLRIGEEDLRSPVYDLTYFGGELPGKRPRARLLALSAVRVPALPARADTAANAVIAPVPAVDHAPAESGEQVESSFPTGQVMLWAGIIFVVLVLGFMAFRMLREIEK